MNTKAMHELLFEMSNDGIVVHEFTTGSSRVRFMAANGVVCRLLGYTAEEMSRLTPLDITAPEEASQVLQDAEQLLTSGTLVRETQFVAKSGTLVPVQISTRLFEDKGRTLALSVIRDLTEAKRAEEALRASERRFRRFFENIREATAINELVRDERGEIADWKLVDANPEALRFFGKPLADIQGRRVSELYGADAQQYIALSRSVMAEMGRKRIFDTYMATTDRYYQAAAFALDDNTYVTTGIDITDRLRAELAVERRAHLESAHRDLEAAARRHWRAFVALSECSQALVRATDEQTLLDTVCRIFVDVAGYRMCWVGFPEHDDARRVRPVAHAGHEDGYLSLINAAWNDTEHGRGPSGTAIRTGEPVVVRNILTERLSDPWRNEALKRGYASLVALPLVAEGTTLGVLRIYAAEPDKFDNDEVKLLLERANDLAFGLSALRARAHRDTMTAQLMLADRMVSIGTLAAGVAHEINNPLAYLIAALDFIEREMKSVRERLPPAQSEEVVEALAEAREGAERVRHVARDLRTFARIDGERRSRVDVRNVMESSINMAFSEIKYRARFVKDYGATPQVLGNEGRLGQVFLNLLINAAQAIPEGHTQENEIRVTTRTDNQGHAIVEVRDSGSGIPPEIVKRIFDPFFTTKPPGVGTGLGLSICRNIVTTMGGDIHVESEVHRGTVFRVILPTAPAFVNDEPPAGPVSVPQGRRGRVLVVDDESSIGAGVRRLLAPEHDVTVLTSAREARAKIADGERFDVILCDLIMPEMTGMDLHQELSTLALDQAQRMVFLTGGAFTSRAQQFLDRVSNMRLEKPFDAGSLRALVGSLLR